MILPKSRILIFTDCMIFGGCEIVLTNIVNNQAIKDHYQLFYSYRNFKEYREQLLKKVNNKITFPLPLLSNESFYYKLSLKKKSLTRSSISILLAILDYSKIYYLYNFIILFFAFKKIKPDILYINNGGYPGAKNCRFAPLVAKIAGIKIVLFNVNNMAFQPKGYIDKVYDRIIDKNIDYYITASMAASIRLADARKFSGSKMVNIPNAVKENESLQSNLLRKELGIDKKTKIIGSVGLLTDRKGFDVLIEAINILKDKNLKLVIFGEGEERTNLEALISKYNLKSKIILPGHRINVIDYMNDFELFVLPSRSNEDMPYVIIEAMMLKKPVIGTRVAGIPEEITDGETGFVIEPNNHIQLAEKIDFFLNNEYAIEEFGEKGYQKYLDSFSYDVVMFKYLELFNSICATK